MSEVLSLLQYPFVQRAILAALSLGVISSSIGILASLKQESFVGEALAHSSLAGVALGLWLSISPTFAALLYALAVALLIPRLKRITQLQLDTLLGVLLPVSMAAGVLLFSALPGYQPQLLSYLFGSVLNVTWQDVIVLFGLLLITAIGWWRWHRHWVLLALDPEYAQIIGVRRQLLEVVYSVWLAVTIILGVRLLGVVLVNALLIIPSAVTRLRTHSLRQWLLLTPVVSTVSVLLGLMVSLFLNAPSGASIAVILGIVFAIASIRR